MYCDKCGDDPKVSLEQCPRCGRCLCERCWGDKTQGICDDCRIAEEKRKINIKKE